MAGGRNKISKRDLLHQKETKTNPKKNNKHQKETNKHQKETYKHRKKTNTQKSQMIQILSESH